MKLLQWGFSDSWPKEKYELQTIIANKQTTRSLMLLQDFEHDEIRELLAKFPDVIDAPNLGRIKGIRHKIELLQERPKRQRPYPTSAAKHDEINKQGDYMLKQNIIRKSKSEYASPVLFREKPDLRDFV
jgi:hypothetical protein